MSTTWSADPDDTLALGTTLRWSPSALVSALAEAQATAEHPEADDLSQAFASLIDCQVLAKALAGDGDSAYVFSECDEACAEALCADALDELEKRLWTASDDEEELQLSATGAALVPARVLGDTAKSLTTGPEVTIALAAGGAGEGIIGFEGSGPGGVRRTTTRLLDGEFPKVRSLFPPEHQTVAQVDKAALVESVKRVALVAERNAAVQLRFDDNGLTLDAGHSDEALATEVIEAQVKGDSITTGFNPQLLLEGLTAIEHPVVELAFTQPSKPAVISGVPDLDGEKDAAFQYLLMPRRLLS